MRFVNDINLCFKVNRSKLGLFEERAHFVQRRQFRKAACGHVPHNCDREHNFVCGNPEDKGHQDYAVKPQTAGKRVKKRRAAREHAYTAGIKVGKQPKGEPRRGGNRNGAPKDEKRPVQHGSDEYLADLRHAVGRQLQRKGGGNARKHCCRKQAGKQKGEGNAQHDNPGQQHGRKQRLLRFCAGSHEKHGNNCNDGGKTTVAWHEVVCEDGDEPFPRAVDNAAADYACGVAPKPHAHGECLFAACMAAFEAMIQVKSDAGKIAKVFQQGEQREKDGHWWQHDGNDPGKHAVHAEYERIMQPAWRAKPLEQER